MVKPTWPTRVVTQRRREYWRHRDIFWVYPTYWSILEFWKSKSQRFLKIFFIASEASKFALKMDRIFSGSSFKIFAEYFLKFFSSIILVKIFRVLYHCNISQSDSSAKFKIEKMLVKENIRLNPFLLFQAWFDLPKRL